MLAIRTEALCKSFGKVQALDGLDLAVEAGTVFGFLGPNGAGKTTTIRILTCLAHASRGHAWINGKAVAGQAHEITQEIGFLPEEPAFYTWMTPQEFLDYVGAIFGLPSSERLQRTRELLSLAGLEDVAKRRIGGFSRGMRQRLALAQALMNRPSVLFLDEPASALDPAGRKEVLDLIEHLGGQCTVLMSSHILADVERVCNVVGIIARGRMVVQSQREALMDRYAQPVFEADGIQSATLNRFWLGVDDTDPNFQAEQLRAEQMAEFDKGIAELRTNAGKATQPEMKKQLEQMVAAMTAQKAAMDNPAMWTQLAAQTKMAHEVTLERHRASMKQFDADWPADSNVLLARRLKEFLELSTAQSSKIHQPFEPCCPNAPAGIPDQLRNEQRFAAYRVRQPPRGQQRVHSLLRTALARF